MPTRRSACGGAPASSPMCRPEQLAAQIAERDERDRQRAESPLVQAPDAVYLDSTGLTADKWKRRF